MYVMQLSSQAISKPRVEIVAKLCKFTTSVSVSSLRIRAHNWQDQSQKRAAQIVV